MEALTEMYRRLFDGKLYLEFEGYKHFEVGLESYEVMLLLVSLSTNCLALTHTSLICCVA
jgi:hypothetical protein